MESSVSSPPQAGSSPDAQTGAPGRPREIEDPSNLWLIHPMSRAVATALVPTPVTPNMVSVASVFFAAGGAACYLWLGSPLGAVLGLILFIAWHVLDGADGDLARRTGRASPIGELVDGVCDHVSQAILYVAFAVMAQATLGVWAWVLALGAALSHFVQSNAYESGRKTYRRWVYGAAWMRQAAAGGPLAALYLGVSNLTNAGEDAVERAMGDPTPQTRAQYRAIFAPLVKASGVLGGNLRTLAAFVAVLAGHPAWFFLFELTALNLALVWAVVARARANAALVRRLSAS